ncbi:MAG: isopentenyl phosphate kinase [candidate division KSB1 bacterium]|nr:isopentenyl phosphate kinase [candidate division KSB1 bacterium]MDZ7342455.1 isopentenyl phosphate kinase [candidate division KSB1 bacterium]
MKKRVIVKIGGSFITDKKQAESLKEDRVRQIAREVAAAVQTGHINLLLAHGAGSYGHIVASQFEAKNGSHPHFGWQAFHHIRQDMIRMNLRILQLCAEEGIFPITVQPSAIAMARDGKLQFMDTRVIRFLLESDQIPLIHGDIVLDEKQDFTIASTEDQIQKLSDYIYFHRIILISDVPGVLDADGKVIPVVDHSNYKNIIDQLGGSAGTDVTGGMRSKVEQIYHLIQKNPNIQAVIISGNSERGVIASAMLDEETSGTKIRY